MLGVVPAAGSAFLLFVVVAAAVVSSAVKMKTEIQFTVEY